MSKMILVYDDDGEFAKQVSEGLSRVDALRGQFSVRPLTDPEFVEAMNAVANRNQAMRVGKECKESCCFDATDIVIVDQDLLNSSAGRFLCMATITFPG